MHSTLELYRRALALRHELQAAEELEWVDTGRADVLHFLRPNGWSVVANFGDEDYELAGSDLDNTTGVVVSSADAPFGVVPAECTIWLTPQ